MKREIYKGDWVHIDEGNYLHVLPHSDTRPHSTQTDGDEREIADIDCPCKPQIMMGNENMIFPKPVIIHNSFQDKEYLDELFPL
jgi:hypothetical protein